MNDESILAHPLAQACGKQLSPALPALEARFMGLSAQGAGASLSYLAGFFDGEGSVIIRNAKWHFVQVQIANCDPRVIVEIHKCFGGTLSTRKARDNKRPCVSVVMAGRVACRFLSAIRPYCVMKADQIDVALAFQSTKGRKKLTQEAIVWRNAQVQKIRVLNGRSAAA